MADPHLPRLQKMYDAVGGTGTPTLVVLEGTPHPKMRHQHGNGKTYQPDKDREAERLTARVLRRAVPAMMLTNVTVVCIFVVPDARTRDEDNMMKHVKDAANGVVYHDDRQVTGEAARTELDRDAPRTLILIGDNDSTLDRTVDLDVIAQRKQAAARRKLEKGRAETIARLRGGRGQLYR